MKLNFQMKSWAFSFPPVSKIILSWSTTGFHWQTTVVHPMYIWWLWYRSFCREVFVAGNTLKLLVVLCCLKLTALAVLTQKAEGGKALHSNRFVRSFQNLLVKFHRLFYSILSVCLYILSCVLDQNYTLTVKVPLSCWKVKSLDFHAEIG